MRQRDRRKRMRRQVVRFFKSPKLAIAYSTYRKAVNAADWPEVKTRVLTVAKIAEQVRDKHTIGDMVAALERVGCYRESAELWFSKAAANAKILPNEWRGENLSSKTLLINLNQVAGSGMGVGYRCAHIVAQLTGRARRTIVIVEKRLIPTYRRTFPGLEIYSSSAEIGHGEVDFVALPAYLLAEFDMKPDLTDADFKPLLVDTELAAALRKKYQARQGDRTKPLIGICWYSSHHGKEMPSLQHWRDFIHRTDATFVSLQYGNVASDVNILGRNRVITDPNIDQLVDMDGFAAQVAALDGTITIINTLANVGGALATPTVVLRDDWFRRNQPVLSDRMPWFPSVRIAGKNRRDWRAVLDEALLKLHELQAKRK